VRFHPTIGFASVLILRLFFIDSTVALAQSADAVSVVQRVNEGRPLEIVLEQRTTVKAVGQRVTGTLVDPIYAYDRIVVPAGTQVLGCIAALEEPSKFAKTRAMLAGDFTPRRHAVLQFDTLLLPDGPMPIRTVVKMEIPHLKKASAPGRPEDDSKQNAGAIGRLEQEAKNQVKDGISSAKQKGRDVLAEITQPGRGERLKNELVQRLPYHPQFIDAGMGYHAQLLAPLDFGTAESSTVAPPDSRPAPSSILHARLITAMDSSKSSRGAPIQAVVTEPVFSAARELIYPEGTVLTGEVTLAAPARSLHRNGQLRFLFESVQPPGGDSSALLASLQAVHASGDDQLAIDEEGGAKATNSKTRFIAPTLAILALRANLGQHDHLDPDGDGHVVQGGSPGALGVGSFIGFGLAGIPLSFMSKSVGIALSAVGAARTTYSNVLGKGREVQFPVDTLIELQLAPGPSKPR
jgi:hypothetical protein